MDLDDMTLDDLRDHRKEVDRAIERNETRQLAEARENLEERAKELGVSLEKVVTVTKTGRKRKPPKYRHPENARRTWNGHGRRPAWFINALEEGHTEEDLKV